MNERDSAVECLEPKLPENIQLAKDGRLILVGGRHSVLKRFTGNLPIAEENLKHFKANHSSRMTWCNEHNISFSQWVFPDPIVFRGSLEEGSAKSVFTSSFPTGLAPDGVYYPLNLLDGHSERQSKTDSHYSPVGNMYLAAEVCYKTIGIETSPETFEQLSNNCIFQENFVGDLGLQCTPHVAETRTVPRQIHGIKSASNGLQAGNYGIVQLVVSPNSATERKLLIFGDSFFRTQLHELARYWREIVFLRTPFFHYEMVAAVAPNDILCGMAERYFPSVRPDSERPHFLAYPLSLGRGIDPGPGFGDLWNHLIDQPVLAGAGIRKTVTTNHPTSSMRSSIKRALTKLSQRRSM